MKLFYKTICFLLFSLVFTQVSYAQLEDECKLDIGVNLSGVVDYGTELPFVDLMKNARQWYTKSIGDPADPFDSGFRDSLSVRPDGYPTHVPQMVPGSTYEQKVVTIWAITDGWTPGQYTILWEGTGSFSFFGAHENLQQTGDNRITFDFDNAPGNVFELTIEASDINDPIHNIRVLLPGSESTYLDEPFNPVWLDKLEPFKTVRFMDWGSTNNWGQSGWEDWIDNTLYTWDERAQMDHYTWATEKGVPYEMMIRLLNDFDLDGWVCVPHKADNEFISEMAKLFRDNLEEERHLTVEYSNEVWNFIFGQTQWLNEYGCIQQGLDWPEGIVPYIQNCLDVFSQEYVGQMDRITRAVGAFTGWLDVTDRIARNMRPGSFDALSPTFYFGFTDEGDMALDALGAAATVSDIAFHAREGMEIAKTSIDAVKTDVADRLGVPLKFYEGGQHMTAHPFGEDPSYRDALLEVHRDSAMYNMYNEWFDYLRTLQEGEEPLQLMHFAFISNLSSQFGSWGMLETMDQDTSVIPAPKYSSILKNLAPESCIETSNEDLTDAVLNVYPNPTSDIIYIEGLNREEIDRIELVDVYGIKKSEWFFEVNSEAGPLSLKLPAVGSGVYFLRIINRKDLTQSKMLAIKN